ncbi:MAG: transcription antitermination factor NusB [bacterium]|nr:transcription antitermination factor NusB [bacterium]
MAPSDPRHLRRMHMMQALFMWDFNRENNKLSADLLPIVKHMTEIDALISKTAPEWPLVQLHKIDLAILRLAIYELLHEKKTPPKVVIDEAVELAKAFGGDNAKSFVNGVLGTIARSHDIEGGRHETSTS